MKRLVMLATALSLVMAPNAMAASFAVSADTYVADFGQTVRTFTISGISEEDAALVTAEDFIVTGDAINQFSGVESTEDVLSVEYKDGALVLDVDDFLFLQKEFVVSYVGEAPLNLSFSKSQLAEVKTEIADQFVAGEQGAIHYRLYVPENASEPLPLVVWTHGGGEGGTDNWIQLVANRGAIAWIDHFKDIVVLAPQTDEGWSEEESLAIGEVIQGLIDEGVVDGNRVYGSGCSAGGRGCILTCSRNGDLYTAIAPICPTMMEDTMKALAVMEQPVWISTAYQDHTAPRDEYIVALVNAMNAVGEENAQYTLYTLEELQAYGLSVEEESVGQNHFSWVLTLNNEYGIMDWMLSQTK